MSEQICMAGAQDEEDEAQEKQLEKYLECHPEFVKRWLFEHAEPQLIANLIQSQPNNSEDDVSEENNCSVPVACSITRSKRNSVTSELFQLWITSPQRKAKAAAAVAAPVDSATIPNLTAAALSRRNLATLDENELFMELIRDVANELDINVLCHKILVNVSLLTHADRGSLFLARGPREARYLVAKLFDVTVETDLEDAIRRAKAEEIRIPFGIGIAGTVAQTKEVVNITDAYQDPRFNCEIDMKTGYKTNLILCLPICNYEGEVIGVAQIINKTDDSKEFTRRDVEVFQRYLTFCGIGIQNAQLFEMSVQEYRRNQILLNLARSIFEEQSNLQCLVSKIMKEARDLLKCERCAVFLIDLDCCEANHLEKILEQPSTVVQEHKPLCRREPLHFQTVFELRAQEEEGHVYRPSAEELGRSRLAQIARYVAATGQILNIGDVSSWMNQEVREEDGFLTKSILCMPIANGQKTVIGVAQLINKVSHLHQKCGVSNGDFYKSISVRDPLQVLCRWVLSVKKNYRPVKYHNWRHALNVGQTMFAMLKTGRMEQFMKDLEILGLLVACLCHDLDHRGTNNSFQTKTESPLAILYTTSTMEHHHFDQCVMILNSEGNNIFQALSTEDYKDVMKIVENAILSTDLAMYFKKRSSFLELVENGEFDWQSEEKKEVLCGMMMTACDVSAIAKPWEVQHKVAKLVADEERKDELPQMQVGFIDVICRPLYKVLSETFPWMQPLYEGCMENRKNWQDLAEKVEMGLTWIDHDTIDKPVEEFTSESRNCRKSCEPEDIEFTVTTLQQTTEKKQFAEHPGRLTRLSKRNGGTRFSSLRHYTFNKNKEKEKQTSPASATPVATVATSTAPAAPAVTCPVAAEPSTHSEPATAASSPVAEDTKAPETIKASPTLPTVLKKRKAKSKLCAVL
ncbi:hypothetical protein B566_EDAN014978 [Ephemera danica]|nr:hypothetical protein B566_EDAN014978 [Ephemera danica]